MATHGRRRPTLEPLESKALLSTGASAQAAVGDQSGSTTLSGSAEVQIPFSSDQGNQALQNLVERTLSVFGGTYMALYSFLREEREDQG